MKEMYAYKPSMLAARPAKGDRLLAKSIDRYPRSLNVLPGLLCVS